jgi:hypothetical protein
MNPDSSVVFNKSELAKAAQECVDTRSRTANHARKSLLGDRLNQRIVFPRLAVLGQQQKHSRQPLFRPVEELIDQIRLCPQVAIEQKRREQIGKSCSSCITLRNSGLAILSAVHAVTAVAIVTRSPGFAAIAFSPKKSLAATRRIVASFPVEESTEILARPLCR